MKRSQVGMKPPIDPHRLDTLVWHVGDYVQPLSISFDKPVIH